MKKYFILFAMLIFAINISAQDFVFFDDSPDETFYDWSWGFFNAPSNLDKIGDKFPVSLDHALSGTNSLRLTWRSEAGGDWGIAVAEEGTPWPTHDITTKDSLIIWVYSETDLAKENLPLIYLEDNTNKKSAKVKLASYANNIPANTWVKISIPLADIPAGSSGTDFTIIKTIFFGQDTDVNDAADHTLFLDEIRMISGGGTVDLIPPAVPTGVSVIAYDSHFDIKWNANTEDDLYGYKIYMLDGANYVLAGAVGKDDIRFSDFIGQGVTGTYKVSAYDGSLNESDMSTEASSTTYAMTDDELLTMLQEANFRYFWDYAHPTSGLARERSGSGNTVTSGGSGFGIMAIIVGVERGFITREEGVQRLLQMFNFLATKADKFHGAFPHWLNGETGKTIPFSQYDNGGDLVETAYLMQGILAARKYFNNQANATEVVLGILATNLWNAVEWDWYRKDPPTNYLYWHWSPDYAWQMNFPLIGWNETMITYLLGIASTTHGVPASLYHNGWTSSNNYANGNSFYGIPIYVGWDYGGPLFFAHYSFFGFDPRNKRDNFCSYFMNNRNTTLINRAYCIDNPKGYAGYDEDTWGLTASDDPFGYLAHEPFSTDNGTISPTAALSSFPYTPTESMAAFKNFYHNYGDKLWGVYGFKDAFNPQQNWFATSYLAIDQGPIVIMVENYRSGKIWESFMANEEIQTALTAIGFTDVVDDIDDEVETLPGVFELVGNYPNPFNPSTIIKFSLPEKQNIKVTVYDMLGRKVKEIFNGEMTSGLKEVTWDGTNNINANVSSGIYIYTVSNGDKLLSGKMILQK
ncbi:MAG: glucoamylase family protein [bacterium]